MSTYHNPPLDIVFFKPASQSKVLRLPLPSAVHLADWLPTLRLPIVYIGSIRCLCNSITNCYNYSTQIKLINHSFKHQLDYLYLITFLIAFGVTYIEKGFLRISCHASSHANLIRFACSRDKVIRLWVVGHEKLNMKYYVNSWGGFFEIGGKRMGIRCMGMWSYWKLRKTSQSDRFVWRDWMSTEIHSWSL